MDIDADGHRDILSGSYSRMEKDMAGLFQVLHGTGGGKFRKAEALKGTDGEPLILPGSRDKNLTDKICTRPFAADWDGALENQRRCQHLGRSYGLAAFYDTYAARIQAWRTEPPPADWDGSAVADSKR